MDLICSRDKGTHREGIWELKDRGVCVKEEIQPSSCSSASKQQVLLKRDWSFITCKLNALLNPDSFKY